MLNTPGECRVCFLITGDTQSDRNKNGGFSLSWRNFQQKAPDLAALGEELIERTGILMLGTLRKDGSPRISPVEVIFADGQLYLGMMWRSKKALDLLRDSRCTA